MTAPDIFAALYALLYWIAVYALAFGVALEVRFIWELIRHARGH